MKIIDSHVHFWDTGHSHLTYNWLKGNPVLDRPFLPSDYRAATESVDIGGIVFVQVAGEPVVEVQWITELANEIPIQAIVASAPLEHGDASRPILDALVQYPLVKGIRRLIQDEAPGFAAQHHFVHMVQALPDYGFSFDICLRYKQLPEAIELVARCPNVAFVLDHIGKPNIAGGEINHWREGIRMLAEHPNVWCKLSGMVTEASHASWTADDLRPYADHVLETFGVNRVMYGSDWPVCTEASPYKRWIETAQAFVSSLSETEQQCIFYENAHYFYRLG
jgi:L-fuconolactonase